MASLKRKRPTARSKRTGGVDLKEKNAALKRELGEAWQLGNATAAV